VNETSTDDQLRDALNALAATVREEPGAYRRASAGWRRRYRRRRLVLTILAATVFVVADGIGLWALSQTGPDTHVIFSDPNPAPGPAEPVGGVGQP
jgi:hypothetical protein